MTTQTIRQIIARSGLDAYNEEISAACDAIDAQLSALEQQGDAVYQIALAKGPVNDAWIDVAADQFDDARLYPDFKRRKLHTAPQHPAADLTDEQIVAGARELCKIHAGQCGVDADDMWAIYSDQFKADAKACLEASIIAKVKGVGV